MTFLSDQPVRLPAAVHAAIVSHARAGKPEEVCGVVRGRGLAAYEAIPGRNIASERIENYEVDPQTLLRQFDFEDRGEEMMGIYHSHPVSVAYPSATDGWNAHYPECIYFICSLEHDDAPVIRAFRMTPYFWELDWGVLKAALPVYETRPRLFAYYQPAGAMLPAALETPAGDVTAPFYIVMLADAEDPKTLDGRVVEVVEHPVRITG